MWEIAAVLGANRADDDARPQMPDGPNPWNVARIRALEAGLPEPQHGSRPPTVEEHARMAAFLETSKAHGIGLTDV